MEANELRIGNYVNCPKDGQNPFRIDLFEYASKGIGKFGMIYDKNTHPLTWYLQDLKPISLTEEWLLKFGLERFPWGWVLSWGKRPQDHKLLISCCKYKNKYWVELGNGLRIEFPYVHTFQNFIILTGHELIIKQ
jgi:hypothetical protein